MRTLATEIAGRPDHLVDLTHQFVERFPKLRTQRGAFGRCKMVSYEFALYLRKRGISAVVTHVQSCVAGTYPNPHRVWAAKPSSKWSHYVVTINGWSLDLSARQFDVTLGVPHMVPVRELRQQWNTVEPDRLINRWVDDVIAANLR